MITLDATSLTETVGVEKLSWRMKSDHFSVQCRSEREPLPTWVLRTTIMHVAGCTLKNLVMNLIASHADGRTPQPRSASCLRIAAMTHRLWGRFAGIHLRTGLQGHQRRLTSFAIWPNVAAQPRLGSIRQDSHVAHPPPLDQSRGDGAFSKIHELLRGRKCPRGTRTWCRRNPRNSDGLTHHCPGFVSRTSRLH